ncbi:cytochrome b-c1 complex subunit 2, mitochondrial [Folsomia candida]|uniref:Cytochrome b-c1 complex subunit 2, mitochondrial n=1 Tax=Folsomia candida TaxID=158441 RepID=A0A226EFY8_FOLCA|nr:cytochrome b-c1 complex subunit 2, mitochondrial [Folsomia candida]OXA56462.1 Cytochrome b-c1 complex subunit 2, mitochondrial [Folsomia candida]
MALQPYARNVALQSKQHVRYLASAAAAIKRSNEPPAPFVARETLKTSKVGNTTVASIETNQAISRLAIYFRAGSRFETDQTQGVVHMLRICAGLGTGGASHFGLTRNVELAGANLSCTAGREFIGYTIDAARDKISSVDKFLQDVAMNQVFKPWEVSDNVPRARLERSIRPPEARLMEQIHKAAFRKGLGYSLYSPKWMLGNHKSEMLSKFVKENFLEAAVVGVGMPHEQAVDFASRLNLSGGQKASTLAKYNPGADLRKETNDRLAYVALAVQGPSLSDPKKATAAALVHRALGTPSRVCHGLAPNSKLTTALGDNDVKAAAVGFSASYSDSGLVGVYIAAPAKRVDAITRKSADILRSAKFSAQDATRAKGILKGDLALEDETGQGLVEYLAVQSLLGKPLPLSEQLALVDSVTAEDMNAVLSGGKLSMAVFGNVSNVPYLDELK